MRPYKYLATCIIPLLCSFSLQGQCNNGAEIIAFSKETITALCDELYLLSSNKQSFYSTKNNLNIIFYTEEIPAKYDVYIKNVINEKVKKIKLLDIYMITEFKHFSNKACFAESVVKFMYKYDTKVIEKYKKIELYYLKKENIVKMGHIYEYNYECPIPSYNIVNMGDQITLKESNASHFNFLEFPSISHYEIHYASKKGKANWQKETRPISFISLKNLSPSTMYEYKVRGLCDKDSSEFSSIKNFVTNQVNEQECYPPQKLIVFNQNPNCVSITWDENPYVNEYKVKFRIKESIGWLPIEETIKTNLVKLPPLIPNREYECKVICQCGNSDKEISKTIKFTTDKKPSRRNKCD